jgi:hypothetical protein
MFVAVLVFLHKFEIKQRIRIHELIEHIARFCVESVLRINDLAI